MVERRNRPRFATEALSGSGVPLNDRGQHFDRDVPLQLGVAGAIDLAHASGPDAADDLVRTEPCSWRERHRPEAMSLRLLFMTGVWGSRTGGGSMDSTPPRRSPSRRCHEPHHLTLTGSGRPCDVRWLERNSGASVQDAMRSTPLFVSMALVPLFLCSSAFSQDGLSLFRKMQDALGGADRIAAIRDFEQDVRAESWNGNTGQSMGEVRKRTRWIRPNYLRIDQVGPGSTYVLYCDGAAGWEILPGTQHVVELTGGELEFARRYVESFRLQTWIADRDPRYRITSPSQNVVRVSDGDIAHQLDITLDA